MRFISVLRVKELTKDERLMLESMKKNHPSISTRTRAQAVLLSDSGFEVQKIAVVFSVCRQSVATWLNAWKKIGVCGLFDKPRGPSPRGQ